MDLSKYREIWRIQLSEDQRIEYIVKKQDPKILGDDARTLVTKIPVRDGDVLLVLRPPRDATPDSPGF